MRFLSLALLLLIALTTHALPQTGIPTAVRGVHGEAISLSGEIGSYGEYYSISGRDPRRPSSTARLYFRPTLSFYDAFSVSLNILLSTEGSSRSARHQMNQINQLGVQPRWKWGYANIGDFTESYTPLTLNGLTIRGGGFSINPGGLRLAATGGLTRRIGAESTEGEFDRQLFAGKIGVGKESRSYFDINVISVKDIPSKFHQVEPDTIVPPDSTQVGTRIQYTESPQENLVIGVAGSLRLFADGLILNSEASGSAYTRDMNSPELDNDKIPSTFSKVFTPRLSSSADYAYTTNLQLRLSPVTFKAGYRYIGPGYVSLGVASMISDLQEMSFGADIRRQAWSTNFHLTSQNDNLLGSKLYTTDRQAITGNISLKPTKAWYMSILGSILTLRNHASSDSALVDFTTISAGSSQMLMFDPNRLLRSIGLNYLFTRASDKNLFRVDNRFQTHTLGANANMVLARNAWLVPMISIMNSRQGTRAWSTVGTFSLTPQWRIMSGKLFISSGIGLTWAEASTSLLTDIAINYRLMASTSITGSLRRVGYNGNGQQGSDYGEYVAVIKLVQKL